MTRTQSDCFVFALLRRGPIPHMTSTTLNQRPLKVGQAMRSASLALCFFFCGLCFAFDVIWHRLCFGPSCVRKSERKEGACLDRQLVSFSSASASASPCTVCPHANLCNLRRKQCASYVAHAYEARRHSVLATAAAHRRNKSPDFPIIIYSRSCSYNGLVHAQ